MKTNAARLLDSLAIKYELRDYEVDPNDLAAESVAAKIGLPPEQVFKTLVARGDRNGICMAVIPAVRNWISRRWPPLLAIRRSISYRLRKYSR
jgi:prolyl-tRNA editing enzyme YbaK/EbsC (Cys-tRNA(Pro) deacylase)